MRVLPIDSCGPPSPPSTWCVWGKLSVFNGLETWFCRKLVVFRNLEAMILKIENLRELACGVEPNSTLRVYTSNGPPRNRLVL